MWGNAYIAMVVCVCGERGGAYIAMVVYISHDTPWFCVCGGGGGGGEGGGDAYIAICLYGHWGPDELFFSLCSFSSNSTSSKSQRPQ